MPLRKESLADSLIALGALIPWWLCLILAAVSYLLLHLVANMDVPNVAGLQDIGANAVTQLFRTVATFAQYLIPGGLLIGAVLAFLKRRANARLYDRTRNGSPDERIAKLSWRQFERLLGEAFRRQHYRTSDTPASADGGVDLRLEKDDAIYLVQCKHWKQSKVGINIVRELNGVIAAQGAAGGFLVTSGTFTNQARHFARDTVIELIDGLALGRMLADLGPNEFEENDVDADEPACPVCNATMVRRVARRGHNKGNEFWGCSNYPSCRGTRPVQA